MPKEYLKDLIKLSEAIFENSEELLLQPSKDWSNDILKKEWFSDNGFENKYISRSPGWYWIACDISFEELKNLICTSEDLPGGACKIGEVSTKNYKTFGEEYLCKLDDSNRRIIYNGHQSNVVIRAREHFTLNNDKTGALGLKYYPLSKKNWKIRFFGKPHINRLQNEIQEEVRSMIAEKSGRIAIENAWRAKYGWPILCKA